MRRLRWPHRTAASRRSIRKANEPDAQTDATRRFGKDSAAQAELADTRMLTNIDADEFDAVFYPGGHGPLWDLSEDAASIALIEEFIAAGKPVAAVCHAPAVLVNAKAGNGRPLVDGLRVTGFSNTEEAAVGLTDVGPFLLEDRLRRLGGRYERADDWQPKVVVDGLLIIGQNPASSAAVADAPVDRLSKKQN